MFVVPAEKELAIAIGPAAVALLQVKQAYILGFRNCVFSSLAHALPRWSYSRLVISTMTAAMMTAGGSYSPDSQRHAVRSLVFDMLAR